MRSRTPGSAWSRSQVGRLHEMGVGVVDDATVVVRHGSGSPAFPADEGSAEDGSRSGARTSGAGRKMLAWSLPLRHRYDHHSSTATLPSQTQAEDLTDALAAFAQLLMRPGRGNASPPWPSHDLSISQVRILHLLFWKRPEPAQVEIAEQIALSVAAAGRAIDTLVRAGLVERHADPGRPPDQAGGPDPGRAGPGRGDGRGPAGRLPRLRRPARPGRTPPPRPRPSAPSCRLDRRRPTARRVRTVKLRPASTCATSGARTGRAGVARCTAITATTTAATCW